MNHDIKVEAAVDEISGLLNGQIGLRPEPTLRGRLRRCIGDEAAAIGRDVQSYASGVSADAEALQRLFNRVTVQETRFFRHEEHFEVLARDLLPALSEPVLIWSAGCANGQEAYSIAMVLEELGIAGSVIATDISTAALQRTAAARYTARELVGLSPARIARHFTRTGKGWQLNDAVRDRVTTLRHNLIDPLPERVRPAQIVFCRNVLIYFSVEHIRTFLTRVADALPGHGCLLLGSAEALWPLSDRFETVRVDDTFIYRPRPLSAAPIEPGQTVEQIRAAHRPVVRREPRPPVHTLRTKRPAAARPRASASRHPAAAIPVESAEGLAKLGQQALDGGHCAAAIVAFRKWVYLAPDDAMAHLHLGLALEVAGDQRSAERAFGAARRAVLHGGSGAETNIIDGYAPEELLRLLEAKDRSVAR